MRFTSTVAIISMLFTASAAHAGWTLKEGLTAADFATNKEFLVDTDSLSWSDGRIAYVTYWRDRQKDIYRCVDFQDVNFRDTANHCYKAEVEAKETAK